MWLYGVYRCIRRTDWEESKTRLTFNGSPAVGVIMEPSGFGALGSKGGTVRVI